MSGDDYTPVGMIYVLGQAYDIVEAPPWQFQRKSCVVNLEHRRITLRFGLSPEFQAALWAEARRQIEACLCPQPQPR
jgi:hypothetical protein